MKTGEYISVSEMNRLLNLSLEKQFPQVGIEGEISEIKRATSGHLYFTLKDAQCQISAVMWRGPAQALKFVPEPGLAVQCSAKPTVYNVTGRLQLVVNQMQPAGEGLLRKKFLELKAKLEKEGLFGAERKRKIPFFPRAVGVVTSAKGAVIHDMMVKFRERMPALKVFLVDVRVQGEGAAQEIAEGIRTLNESGLVETIIVARGGGSLEDLWAFNEEVVVRAIFASKLPVISGVGHEVDVTLSDLVADLRAPTPTAAAEYAVPKRADLLLRIGELQQRLSTYQRWLNPLMQRVDELQLHFDRRFEALMKQKRLQFERATAQLRSIQPGRILSLMSSKIDLLREKLHGASGRTVTQRGHLLERLVAKFEAVSPKRVLERGFSVVESKGKVVRSASALQAQDEISISFFEGGVAARVERIKRG